MSEREVLGALMERILTDDEEYVAWGRGGLTVDGQYKITEEEEAAINAVWARKVKARDHE
jgi:hypothetical protein